MKICRAICRARCAAVLVFTLCLVGVPRAARAHGHPDHADPRVGSTVPAAPSQVCIWFDTELEPAFSSITVHAASGASVDNGDGRVDPSDHKMLEVGVPQLPAGSYRVTWSVASRDGHRTSGDYTFTIGG